MFTRAISAAALTLVLGTASISQAQGTDPIPAPPAATESIAGGLGHKGVVSVGADASANLGYLNIHGQSGFALNLDPAVDYFVADHLSLGGALRFNVTSVNSTTNVIFGLEPRVGFAIAVTPTVTIWPRAGLEFDTSSTELVAGPFNVVGATGGGVIFGLDADMPVLFRPTEHFYIGFGPTIHTEFSGDLKSNFVGVQFYLGGWMQT